MISEQLRDALRHVTTGGTFTSVEMAELVDVLMQADLDQEPIPQLAGAFICSLKTRGETPEEIYGAASSLRKHQIGVVTVPAPNGVLMDTCGTGGDSAHLVNISTMTGLVVASLGIPVAKHGNRSVSSSCGSADLLEQLGYPLHNSRNTVASMVEKTGFGFLFAPHFHPALKNLSSLRRTLGVRTMFNMLGPLVNPAAVTHQLIGVFDREIVTPMARAAAKLGLKRCLVVHGEGGLDELSPNGVTWVSLAEQDTVTELEWTPKSFGAKPLPLEALKGGKVKENADKTKAFLNGQSPQIASAVAMNCAACLWLAEDVDSLEEGYEKSYQAVQSGSVGAYFERCLVAATSA